MDWLYYYSVSCIFKLVYDWNQLCAILLKLAVGYFPKICRQESFSIRFTIDIDTFEHEFEINESDIDLASGGFNYSSFSSSNLIL